MLLLVLSHASTSDLILAGFVAACALLPLLAELLPGKRRDQDKPPDAGEGDDVQLAALKLGEDGLPLAA